MMKLRRDIVVVVWTMLCGINLPPLAMAQNNPFCNICGPGMTWTQGDNVISIPHFGEHTCAHLHQRSIDGMVPPANCNTLRIFTGGDNCGCVQRTPPPSTAPPSSAPTITAAPSKQPSEQPSTAPSSAPSPLTTFIGLETSKSSVDAEAAAGTIGGGGGGNTNPESSYQSNNQFQGYFRPRPGFTYDDSSPSLDSLDGALLPGTFRRPGLRGRGTP